MKAAAISPRPQCINKEHSDQRIHAQQVYRTQLRVLCGVDGVEITTYPLSISAQKSPI